MTSSTKKYLGHIILRSATYALSGSIEGAVDATVLADSGYEGYSVLETVRSAAVGDAVIGAVIGMIWDPIAQRFGRKDDAGKKSEEEHLFEIVLATGLNVLGGMLGKVILQEIIEMPYEKIAAAMGTGGGVFGAVLLCLYCCTYSVNKAVEEDNDHVSSNNPKPQVLTRASSSMQNLWSKATFQSAQPEPAINDVAPPPYAAPSAP